MITNPFPAPAECPPTPAGTGTTRPAEVLGRALDKAGPGFCSVGTVLAAGAAS